RRRFDELDQRLAIAPRSVARLEPAFARDAQDRERRTHLLRVEPGRVARVQQSEPGFEIVEPEVRPERVHRAEARALTLAGGAAEDRTAGRRATAATLALVRRALRGLAPARRAA